MTCQEEQLKNQDNYPPGELKAAYTIYQNRAWVEANDAFDMLLAEIDSAQNMRLYIAALELKAMSYRRLSGVGYQNAFPIILQARDLTKKHLPETDLLAARVYRTLGQFYHQTRSFFKARDMMDTTTFLYSKANTFDNQLYESIVDYKYYTYFESGGSKDTLIKYVDFRYKRELLKDQPDVYEILYTLQDFPDLYISIGDYEKALTYAIQGYRYAIENRKEMLRYGKDGFEVYANSYVNLLDVLLSRKDYQEALQISTSLLDEIKLAGYSSTDYDEYYAVIRTIGQIYFNLEDYENALLYFQDALNIGQGNSDYSVYYGRVLLSVADCFLELGDIEKGLSYYNEGLGILKAQIRMPSTDLHKPYNDFGNFYYQLKDYNQALMKYDSALMNSLAMNENPWYQFPNDSTQDLTLLQINTIALKASLFDEIVVDSISQNQLYKYGLEYADRIHEILLNRRQEFSATEGKLFLSEEFRFVYETALDLAYQLYLNDPSEANFAEALKFVRLSKSILFLEQSAEYEKVNNNIVDQELKLQFSVYKNQLDRIENGFYSLMNSDVTSDSIISLNDSLSVARYKLDAVLDSIDQQLSVSEWPEYEGLFNTNLKNIEQKRGLAQIEYFFGEDHIYTLAFGNGRTSFHRTPLTDAVVEDILGVINEVSSPPIISSFNTDEKVFGERAFNLYTQLILPVLEEIGSVDKLLIIPDQDLSRLPFEVLISEFDASHGFSKMKFLIKDYSIRYQLSSLDQINTGVTKPKNKILGLGYSGNIADDTYTFLPGTEKEINFLKASYEGTFLNSASKDQFLELSGDFDIIHLAIHGNSDSLNKYESRLIFSAGDERELKTSDLYLAGLNARLAILSACESGLGQINKGEGTFSIARGFALSGVPSVVMSLWKVNDKITSKLMESMYVHFIEDGESINESLDHAKQDYLKDADGYFSHPYYWASFVHLGEDIEYEDSKANIFIYVFFGAMLLVGLGAMLNKKRKRTV